MRNFARPAVPWQTRRSTDDVDVALRVQASRRERPFHPQPGLPTARTDAEQPDAIQLWSLGQFQHGRRPIPGAPTSEPQL